MNIVGAALYSMASVIVLMIILAAIVVIVAYFSPRKIIKTKIKFTAEDRYYVKLLLAGILAILSIATVGATALKCFPSLGMLVASTLGSILFMIIIGSIIEMRIRGEI